MEWKDNSSGKGAMLQTFQNLHSDIGTKPQQFEEASKESIVMMQGPESSEQQNKITESAQNSNKITVSSKDLLEQPTTSQLFPKKRGGFQITNVKELVEDESADDEPSGANDYSEFEHGSPIPDSGQLSDILSQNATGTSQENSELNNSSQKSLIHQQRSQSTSQMSTVASGSVASSRARSNVSTTPCKTGASRVYKLVKREGIHPCVHEVERWTSFDFSDGLAPNLSFGGHSHADSSSTLHRETGPYSISNNSSYSVLLSSSSMTLHHNNSNDPRSIMSTNLKLNTADLSFNRRGTSDDSRMSETSSSDQEAAKGHQHASNLELDEDSVTSPNVRIDNKIEAAMDLVKNHLMLAVRDEVDELKERIVDLQFENETIRGVLTPDQLALVASTLQRTPSFSTARTEETNQNSAASTLDQSAFPFSMNADPSQQITDRAFSVAQVASQTAVAKQPMTSNPDMNQFVSSLDHQAHAKTAILSTSRQQSIDETPASMLTLGDNPHLKEGPLVPSHFPQSKQVVQQTANSPLLPLVVNPLEPLAQTHRPTATPNPAASHTYLYQQTANLPSIVSPTYSHPPGSQSYSYPAPAHDYANA